MATRATAATSAGLANPSKQKGTAFETLVENYLNERGLPCERRTLNGSTDKGDIAGVVDWTLELKNHKKHAIGEWVDEARVEAKNAKTRWYAAIVKRPRKGSAAEAFVVMPLSLWVDLILERRETQQQIGGS